MACENPMCQCGDECPCGDNCPCGMNPEASEMQMAPPMPIAPESTVSGLTGYLTMKNILLLLILLVAGWFAYKKFFGASTSSIVPDLE